MRRVGFHITLTADGMYADPRGDLAWVEPAEPEHRFFNELLRAAGDVVMGRRMYELMGFWDELDLDDPTTPDVLAEFAGFWRETPKHVVSRGRPTLGPNAVLLEGDVADALRRMKAAEGPPIMIGGGAELFATLAEAELIDDFGFILAPVAIGQGKAMFGSLTRPLRLRLTDTRRFDSGTVLLEYVRA